MKKQANPFTKAHLIRSAFYLVLLIAACATPLALAQRNVGYQNATRSLVGAKDQSQRPKFPYSSIRDRQITHLPAGTETPTPTPSASGTASASPSVSETPSATPSASGTPSASPSVSETPSASPSVSETPSATPSASGTPSASPSVSPTPTASGTPTATPVPGCGLLVGDGLAVGFAPNDFTLIASNIVNYTFSNSQTAPNDFAIFQTHDPFGATIVEAAITAAGHTFSVFTPGDLAGFDFTQYRVIILNWDDHFVADFLADYTAAIPSLEAYISGGGVVWVQGAIQGDDDGQGNEEDSYPLPFGGQSNFDPSSSDPIVDPSSPMAAGVSSPITGNFASNASDEDLPEDAHVVVVNCQDENGNGENCDGENGEEQSPVLYELRRGASCTPTPTPTPGACVRGQGFWKNHSDQWPVTELQLGNTTYTQDQLLSIMHQPVRGNGLILLARQEIAAKLNIASGAEGSCVQQTLADADTLIGDLVIPPIGDGFLRPNEVSGLMETLGDYNEGELCAPSCDESSPSPSPSPRSTPRSRMPAHPRPHR